MTETINALLPWAGVLSALMLLWMWVGPLYNIWEQRMAGRADLAKSEAETRIAVQIAMREREAAVLYAQADVERAKGVALAIKEIEGALGGAEGYLRWQYIKMLEEQEGVQQIIYVPTEAGLPILEAGKRPDVLKPETAKS